jgi:hypothetical protein
MAAAMAAVAAMEESAVASAMATAVATVPFAMASIPAVAGVAAAMAAVLAMEEPAVAAVAGMAPAVAPMAARRTLGAAAECHHQDNTVHSVYLLQTKKKKQTHVVRKTSNARSLGCTNSAFNRCGTRDPAEGRNGGTGILLRVKMNSITHTRP